MPTSWLQVIPNILDEISKFNPKSILDIGIGFGKYGVLLREKFELPYERYHKEDWAIKIDGIEIYSEYQNPLHEYVYNQVLYGDITNLIKHLPRYDIVLMIDILEHIEKKNGIEMIKQILNHTKKALIISTPQYPDPQKEYLSNPYEEHKSRWFQLDFIDFDFDYKMIHIGNNSAQIIVIYPPPLIHNEFKIDHISLATKNRNRKNLTIGYFLPHKNMTGGLKMLLEQMKHLRKRGHKVYVFYKGTDDESALPSWIDMEVDHEVIVPHDQSFLSYIKDCDVGIAGWVDQLLELSRANIPIVYWEQGNEYLFGDNLNQDLRLYLQLCYQQPLAITSVSPTIAKILKTRFGRNTPVFPNGIDTDFYYPDTRPNENIILLVGNPNLLFKGFDIAIRTLFRVWRAGYPFKVKWLCQAKPLLDQISFPFPIEYIVMPTQEELASHYRKSDLLLFTSWYEGFGMPPLEAMASGVPVVSTHCGGIEAYAQNEVNVLLADPGDVEKLAENIIQLLNDKELYKKLSIMGRKTAIQFSFTDMSKQLENYLFQLVSSINHA